MPPTYLRSHILTASSSGFHSHASLGSDDSDMCVQFHPLTCGSCYKQENLRELKDRKPIRQNKGLEYQKATIIPRPEGAKRGSASLPEAVGESP